MKRIPWLIVSLRVVQVLLPSMITLLLSPNSEISLIGALLISILGIGVFAAFMLSKGSRRRAPPDPVDPPKPLPKATVRKIGPERKYVGTEKIGEVPPDFCETCGGTCDLFPPKRTAQESIDEQAKPIS